MLAVDGQISVGALIGANILAARALMPIIRYVSAKNSLLMAENSIREINEYLKKYKKPILDFQPIDSFAEPYMDFYNNLLS